MTISIILYLQHNLSTQTSSIFCPIMIFYTSPSGANVVVSSIARSSVSNISCCSIYCHPWQLVYGTYSR